MQIKDRLTARLPDISPFAAKAKNPQPVIVTIGGK